MIRLEKMNPSDIQEEYFRWLSFYAVGTSKRYENYMNLLSTLHSQEFYYKDEVPMDENRLVDGVGLRDAFEDEIGYSTDGVLDRECSMLEMLVALAMAFREVNNEKKSIAYYFFEMLNNLQLQSCTDEHWDELIEDYTFNIIERLLERDYDYDGSGGLFPLNYAQEDQRNVEIWYQLAAYYNENYYDYDSEV